MTIETFAVLGNRQRLDGGAMFGNVPKSLWSSWLPAGDDNCIDLACRCLLVRDGRRNILFETGIGAFFSPELRARYGVTQDNHVLLDSLAALDLTPDQIDIVVLSHLHFDHAGGLLSAYRADAPLELVFPRATFVVGQVALQRARNPHPRDRASFIPELVPLLMASGRLHIETEERSALLGSGFKFHMSNGHTPGLLLTEIETPEGPLVFASDLIPGRAWVHLPVTMGYDRYPELLIDEKRGLLSALVERKGSLFFTHDPEVASSRVVRDTRGKFTVAP